jgi:hypothetical protein
VKPLYGVPETGNYWFKTYHSYYINKLAIEQSTYDLYFLYNKQPFGVISLQTNDTLIVGDDDFLELEQLKLKEV